MKKIFLLKVLYVQLVKKSKRTIIAYLELSTKFNFNKKIQKNIILILLYIK